MCKTIILLLVLILLVIIPTIVNLIRYAQIVATDGDYLNDWITHLPDWMQGTVIRIGKWACGR